MMSKLGCLKSIPKNFQDMKKREQITGDVINAEIDILLLKN
jgi:hypothetical protein